MASISPTSVQCSPEPHSGKKAYLKLTITSISDSDATTNKRYVGWKITVEGTAWSAVQARYATLGGHEIVPLTIATITNWTTGQQLDSGNETYSNDASGNLTLHAYLKQLFYYYYSDSRWNSSTAQVVEADMVCSQLPRYANFTQHYINATGINTFGVHWEADASCDASQYSLNGGSWTNGATWPNYTISSLSPGTNYNIRTRIKRSDSQLWTESGYLYVTTASLPSTGTPNNFNLGSSPTASINSTSNLSHWYVHTYDGNTLLNDSGAIYSTSKTIDLTNSTLINQMLARHSNENEWNITFKYYCVSNGVTYTLTQRTCKCIIPQGQYTPTFNENNVSYEVIDQQTLDLTQSNQKIIKGISDVLVTLTPAGPNGGATMKSYNATSGNSTGSTTNINTPTISLTNVSADSVTVQAVDSRNRTTNTNKAFSTFIDYFAPVITNASINRVDGVGTNLVVNITGNYCNWSGLATTNIMEQVSIQYKLKSASTYTTISGVNLNIVNNNGAFTITGNITGNYFSAAEEYDVLLTFKDKINNLPFYQAIPTGEALLWKDLANKRIGICKKPEYTLDVNGDINATGVLRGSSQNITGNSIIGGNQTVNGLQVNGHLYLNEYDLTTTYVDKGAISAGTSWKSITEQGLYNNSNNMLDRPSESSSYGILKVTKRPSTGGNNYIFYEYTDANNNVFTNMIWAGVEIGWQKMINSNDMKTIVVEDVISKNLLPANENEIVKFRNKYYFDKPLPHGSYTLSVENIVSSGTAGQYVFTFLNTNGTVAELYINLTDTLFSRTFTIDRDFNRIDIYAQESWSSSQNITTTYTKLMLNKGTTKLSYTPYKRFNNQQEYSEHEIKVGTWIDGKTIYRKVVSFNPRTDALETSYAHGISNINEVLPTSSCILHRTNGNFVPFAMTYPANATNILAWSIGWQASKTAIFTWIGENMRAQIDTTTYGAVAVLEYTKTN